VRLFIVPLGFHEDIVLRALIRLGAQPGDVVYTVTCGPAAEAVKRAFESLQAQCLRQGLPEPKLLELNCRDFYGSIRAVRSTLSEYGEAEVFFCSGGGLRILTHIVEVALFVTRRPFNLHYEPEGEGASVVDVPNTLFRVMYEGVRGIREKVLRKVIENPGIAVKEISQMLGVEEKTVQNALTWLKERGLVVRKPKGRARPTEIAVALYG